MKFREYKATRFGPGDVAATLLLMAAVPFTMSRIPSSLEWLAEQMRRAGLGNPGPLVAGLLVLCVVAPLAAAAGKSGSRHKHRQQSLRDSEALVDGTFALFLRPYFTDTAIALLNPFYSAWNGGLTLESPVLAPEEFVGRVLEPFIRVREVGGSPTTIGSARIRVADEAWKTAVQEAIHAASVVIVLPLAEQDENSGATRGESTVWELQYLAESGWMDRTIVLMPDVPWRIRKRTRAAWEHARERVSEFGVELPPYEDRGVVLTFVRRDGAWRAEGADIPVKSRRKRMAAELIEAISYTAERFQFQLGR